MREFDENERHGLEDDEIEDYVKRFNQHLLSNDEIEDILSKIDGEIDSAGNLVDEIVSSNIDEFVVNCLWRYANT